MPALGLAEMLEVTAIHCAARLLGSGHALGWSPATGGCEPKAAVIILALLGMAGHAVGGRRNYF
jgi:hypothetical protein